MLNFINLLLTLSMAGWYGAIRWLIFTDRVRFKWAYTEINLFTAFTSIIFLFPILVFPEFILSNRIANVIFYYIACFLLFRNIFYAIEDIYDLLYSELDPKMQAFFIIVDFAMAYVAFIWAIKSHAILY